MGACRSRFIKPSFKIFYNRAFYLVEQESAKIVSGKIQINSFDQLLAMSEGEGTETIVLDEHGFRLGLSSRMFALEPIDSNGSVGVPQKE